MCIIPLPALSLRSAFGDAKMLGRIMPLGDSITAGRNMTGTTPGAYRDPLYTTLTQNGYTFQFVGTNGSCPTPALTSAHQELHEGHSGFVIERGTSGHDGITDHIAAYLSNGRPDIILLMIGTNDVATGYNVDRAPERLDILISRIFSRLPDVRLIVAGVTPFKDDSKDNLAVRYNTAIAREVADHQKAGENVSFVNMHDALNRTTDMADLLHPSRAGYEKMADVWYMAITKASSSNAATRP
jgi:lysophospholipase L1-like esterase